MRKAEKATKLAKTLEYERLKKGMTHEEFSNFLGIPRSSVTTYLDMTTQQMLEKSIEIFGLNVDITILLSKKRDEEILVLQTKIHKEWIKKLRGIENGEG